MSYEVLALAPDEKTARPIGAHATAVGAERIAKESRRWYPGYAIGYREVGVAAITWVRAPPPAKDWRCIVP